MKRNSILFLFSKSPNYNGPSVEDIAREMKRINQEREPGAFANALAEYDKMKKTGNLW